MVIWLVRRSTVTAPSGSDVVAPPGRLVTSPPVPQAVMNRSSPGEVKPAPCGQATWAPPLRSVSMPMPTTVASSSSTVPSVTR